MPVRYGPRLSYHRSPSLQGIRTVAELSMCVTPVGMTTVRALAASSPVAALARTCLAMRTVCRQIARRAALLHHGPGSVGGSGARSRPVHQTSEVSIDPQMKQKIPKKTYVICDQES